MVVWLFVYCYSTSRGHLCDSTSSFFAYCICSTSIRASRYQRTSECLYLLTDLSATSTKSYCPSNSRVYHLLCGSGSTVLTATGFVYGNPKQIRFPLADRQKLSQVITSATLTAIPNVVQTCPQSGQMREI